MSGLIVDNFAGCGGASLGIERAMGRPVDIAINHDAVALGVHAANHPETVHRVEDIYAVDPKEVCNGHPVRLAWFSPDCRHHSKAKGGRPVSKSVRGLAWVVIRWAVRVKPDVIVLENVEEFRDWGPLDENGKAIKEQRGQTFDLWVARLRDAGYRVDWRELRACDYGAPTIRKRFFLIARRDGQPIVWPGPTHGGPDSLEVASGQLAPWRTAAEIIDWHRPCPSIFDTSEEIMEKYGIRAKRPLADATLKRIARGVVRYVLESPKPFIVGTAHGEGQGRGHAEWSMDAPLRTVAQTGDFALCTPFVTKFTTGATGHRMDCPLVTVTANSFEKRAGGAAPLGLVAPTLVQTGYGEREGQAPRVPGLHKPLGTQMAGGSKHALVAAFLAQHNTGVTGHRPDKPLSTLTGKGSHQQVVAVNLMHQYSSSAHGGEGDLNKPIKTQTATGNHACLIASFLTKYYGTWQTPELTDPMPTDTTKDRFALVTVTINGETFVLVDIGMRMLTPRERARAQGFPDTYILEHLPDGTPVTATDQGRLVGNSVPHQWAEAIVTANLPEAVARRSVA